MTPFPMKFVLSDPHPFQTAQFPTIFAHSASTVKAGEKVQLALIGSRPRTFQWAIDESCTLPLSPATGGTKRNIAIFPVNFNFCRIKSATKFLCVKTASGKVVATSFLYLTVYRWIASDVPIYQKLRSKWPTPSENADFDRFRLIVPQPWAIDEPRASPLSPQRVAQNENFLHLALPFISSL